MLRFTAAVLALSALTLGLASAKPPEKSYPIEKAAPLLRSKATLDPVWTRQLTKHAAKVTVPDIKVAEPPPNFKGLKRLDPVARGVVLQAPPEQVTGPIRYSIQKLHADDQHFLVLESNSGQLYVRTSQNYAFFGGADSVMTDIYRRPRAFVRFQAEPGRRYLLECLVDVGGATPGNISASVAAGPSYSVNTVDRASLLFVYTGGASSEAVWVELAGDRPWYLDGCELSWTGG